MEVSKLNEERKRQNLSVSELAQRANLPKGTVEKVLFGVVQNPRIDTMQAIERALGISDGWTAADRAAGVVERMSVPITADEDEILTLLREVEEKKGAAAREVAQRVVVSVLEEMLK